MNAPVLLVEQVDEATALVTLNRPERRNALTIELMEALCTTFDSLAGESRRRIAILRGAGPAFCAGLDLHEAAQLDVAERSAEWVVRTFETIAASPLITIAAAHGAAYAGGAGLLACCDFALAADDLRISFPEVRRGLVPALVAAVLKGRVREGELRELFLIGEPITAERAWAMGLIQRVVPGDRLIEEARSLAAKILMGAPQAVRQTKRILRELRPHVSSQWLAQALAFHKEARLSDEAREGLAAFLERREPNWPSPSPRNSP